MRGGKDLRTKTELKSVIVGKSSKAIWREEGAAPHVARGIGVPKTRYLPSMFHVTRILFGEHFEALRCCRLAVSNLYHC